MIQKVLHLKAKVLAGGRIEIVDPELPVGEAVDVTAAPSVRDAAAVGS